MFRLPSILAKFGFPCPGKTEFIEEKKINCTFPILGFDAVKTQRKSFDEPGNNRLYRN
jgi:hypothetical protein